MATAPDIAGERQHARPRGKQNQFRDGDKRLNGKGDLFY